MPNESNASATRARQNIFAAQSKSRHGVAAAAFADPWGAGTFTMLVFGNVHRASRQHVPLFRPPQIDTGLHAADDGRTPRHAYVASAGISRALRVSPL